MHCPGELVDYAHGCDTGSVAAGEEERLKLVTRFLRYVQRELLDDL